MTAKAVLGLIPTMQSLALAGHTYRSIPKIPKKPCPGSKIRSQGKGRGLGVGKGKGPIGAAAGILVGIPLIKATAGQVAAF